MKKLTALILALVLILPALAGCGGNSAFILSFNEDESVSVTAEHALPKSMGVSSLFIDEGEEVVIETAFNEKGTLRFELLDAVPGIDDNPFDLPEEAMVTLELSGTDNARFTAPPGDYTLRVTVLSLTDGTALIRAEQAGG